MMKVRFARWFAIQWIVIGAIPAAAGVMLIGRGAGGAGVSLLAPGAVSIFIGLAYLGPFAYVLLDESSIVVRPGFGIAYRTTVGPHDRVQMVGNRIVVIRSGRRQRLHAYRFISHRGDWNRMTAELAERGRRQGRIGGR